MPLKVQSPLLVVSAGGTQKGQIRTLKCKTSQTRIICCFYYNELPTPCRYVADVKCDAPTLVRPSHEVMVVTDVKSLSPTTTPSTPLKPFFAFKNVFWKGLNDAFVRSIVCAKVFIVFWFASSVKCSHVLCRSIQ